LLLKRLQQKQEQQRHSFEPAAAQLVCPYGKATILETPGILGIPDPAIALAYILCIFSALLCIGYGIVNWNKGDEPQQAEDQLWAEEEKRDTDETF